MNSRNNRVTFREWFKVEKTQHIRQIAKNYKGDLITFAHVENIIYHLNCSISLKIHHDFEYK